jgi:hypothetical protein
MGMGEASAVGRKLRPVLVQELPQWVSLPNSDESVAQAWRIGEVADAAGSDKRDGKKQTPLDSSVTSYLDLHFCSDPLQVSRRWTSSLLTLQPWRYVSSLRRNNQNDVFLRHAAYAIWCLELTWTCCKILVQVHQHHEEGWCAVREWLKRGTFYPPQLLWSYCKIL